MKETVSRVFTSPWLLVPLGSVLAFKIWMKLTSGRFEGRESLKAKTVIVTGANSGVGLEAAKDFARRGARVIMVCRDMKKAKDARIAIVKETGNDNVILKHADFAKLSTVRKCAQEILSEERRIHVLLNNAGVFSDAFTDTRDGLDVVMQTNHFGPFLFTNILTGRLRESAPSRIVFVSSEMYKMADLKLQLPGLSETTSQNVAYGNSKLCSILTANELANKLDKTGVTVNSLTPGVVKTNILRRAPGWYRVLWNFMATYLLKTPEEGAQTLIYACVSSQVADVSGAYFMDCKRKDLSEAAKDAAAAKKLWDISERAVNLRDDEIHYR